jgi:hypothetical protein
LLFVIRKYKAGYVWQDVKDDDLITPVSDNEYVLKGCDARGTPPPSGFQAPRRTSSFGDSSTPEFPFRFICFWPSFLISF